MSENLPQQYEQPLHLDNEFARLSRRQFLKTAAIVTGAVIATPEILSACTSTKSPVSNEQLPTNKPEKHETDSNLAFILKVGDSIVKQGEEVDLKDGTKGLRFRSKIQDNHPYTDRDVGAAGIAISLLSLAAQFPDHQIGLNGKAVTFLDAAKMSGNWLISASAPSPKGGRYWPDYVDDGGDVSNDAYSSFDDGLAGQIDTQRQLYLATGDENYRQAAIDGLLCLNAHGEKLDNGGVRWLWNFGNPSADGNGHYEGIGMGNTGIAYTLATAYKWLKTDPHLYRDPKLHELVATTKANMDGVNIYLESVKNDLGNELGAKFYSRTEPETDVRDGKDGNTNINSGYLSGTAGNIYLNLALAKLFPKKRLRVSATKTKSFLELAEDGLAWLENKKPEKSNTGPMVLIDSETVTWKLAKDPEGGDDDSYPTGVEEGTAGIGWVYLEAYKVTEDKHYLEMAKLAGNWLMKVAKPDHRGGYYWYEAENSQAKLVHPNLNNGAAGIGTFLQDLAIITKDQKYQHGADRAATWLRNTAKSDINGNVYWEDVGKGDDNSGKFNGDGSLHWGKGGIALFLLRNAGSKIDMAGEQPSLTSPQFALIK